MKWRGNEERRSRREEECAKRSSMEGAQEGMEGTVRQRSNAQSLEQESRGETVRGNRRYGERVEERLWMLPG